MKILKLLAVCLFSSSLLLSCSDDSTTTDKGNPIIENPDNPGNNVTVKSTWEPKSILISKGIISLPMDYPHSEGCTKDYLQLLSNDTAKFFHYEETSCNVTEYGQAFQRTGNNVTLNVMGYSIKGVITSETSTSMEIQSEISEYIPYIKAMFPQYESQLTMLDGATVKLLLTKK